MKPMPRRRLEDRIRELCAKASEPNWRSVLGELRLAIHEHALKMSNLAIAAVVNGQPQIICERRDRRVVLNPRRIDANAFDSETYDSTGAVESIYWQAENPENIAC